jgi:hypothetical protein
VERSTTFRGIPKGKYFVHLYGIYTRGRQTLVLSEPCETVEVFPRKSAFVAFNLESSEAEFKLTVVDDVGPVEGARVWLDKDRAKAVPTAKDGTVTMKVPKGYHVIQVTAKGIQVERPYHVIKAKIHEMTINLVWERRQEHASRALERQVDDALPYLTQTRQTPGSVPAVGQRPSATTAPRTAHTAPTAGDTINIPLAGKAPPAGSIQGPLTRPSQPVAAAASPRSTPQPVPAVAPTILAQPSLRPSRPQPATSLGKLAPLSQQPTAPVEPPAGSLMGLAPAVPTEAPVDLPMPPAASPTKLGVPTGPPPKAPIALRPPTKTHKPR